MSNRHKEDKLYELANSILIGDSKPEGKKMTYRKGDIIINIGESMDIEPIFICIKGGTPGEWIAIGGGGAASENVPVDIDIEAIVARVREDMELVQGPEGPQGEVGPQGPEGPAGKDVDPEVLLNLEERLEMLEEPKHKITGVPEGTVVEYREDEIRVMCPKNAVFTQQNVGEGGSSNMYYMAMTTQAPEGAVAFNEGDKGVISEKGVDLEGKKQKTIWLAMASLSGSTWTYFGKNSTAAKPIGWDYIIEWLDGEGNILRTDIVRINLTNEECHGVSLFSAVKELANMFKFNDAGELEVTIGGVKKVFVPKE